nr:F-box domain, leucine-rich repeat domain, L domain-like protein [Tanacetum cinerariifolium]
MSADVGRSHGGDGRGEDRPLQTMYHAVACVALLTETQFDLMPHMESPDWTEINADIQQHLQKAYNTNKAAFKEHCVIDPMTGTYNVEKIRREHPKNITDSEWDKFIEFWNEEMRRLEATGTYTDDEINHLDRGGKQQRHIDGVGRVLPARATAIPSTPT